MNISFSGEKLILHRYWSKFSMWNIYSAKTFVKWFVHQAVLRLIHRVLSFSEHIICDGKYNIKRLKAVVFLNRGFHDKIKFYILRQNLHQTWFNDFSNVKWCMKQTLFKVCQVAQAAVAYLDKHSTLDPVIVSVVSSIPSGGRQLFAEIF